MKGRWAVVVVAVLGIGGWMAGCSDDSDDEGTGPDHLDTLVSVGAVEPGWWWVEEVRDELRAAGVDSAGQPFAYQTYANHTVRCSVTAKAQNADSLWLSLLRTDTLWTAAGGVDRIDLDTTYMLQTTGQHVYVPAVLPVYQDFSVELAFYPWCALPLTVGTTWTTMDTAVDFVARSTYPMVGAVRVRLAGGIRGTGQGSGMVERVFGGATRACIVKTTLDSGRVAVMADSAIALGTIPLADSGQTLRVFTYRGDLEEHVCADLSASLWRRGVVVRLDSTAIFLPTVKRDTLISVATLKVLCRAPGDTLRE